MTKAKIAISLPKPLLVKVRREVRAGRAASVSGYIADVLEAHQNRESVEAVLNDWIAQAGEPSEEAMKWAQSVLPKPE